MATKRICHWIEDGGFWATGCHHCFEFTDGTPDENDFKYCCFCGKKLVQLLGEEEEDLTE